MQVSVEPSPPPICTSCGGTGLTHTTYGPFLVGIPKRWRDTVLLHLLARHEVFEKLDHEIARQVVPVEKDFAKGDVTMHDVLVEMSAAADSAATAWREGRIGDAWRYLLKVSTSAVYAMESMEVASQRMQNEPE